MDQRRLPKGVTSLSEKSLNLEGCEWDRGWERMAGAQDICRAVGRRWDGRGEWAWEYHVPHSGTRALKVRTSGFDSKVKQEKKKAQFLHLPSFILSVVLRWRRYCLHFTNEEIKTQIKFSLPRFTTPAGPISVVAMSRVQPGIGRGWACMGTGGSPPLRPHSWQTGVWSPLTHPGSLFFLLC